jgi:hypothetical protein
VLTPEFLGSGVGAFFAEQKHPRGLSVSCEQQHLVVEQEAKAEVFEASMQRRASARSAKPLKAIDIASKSGSATFSLPVSMYI